VNERTSRHRLVPLVVARGAATALLLAVPATLGNVVLAAQDDPSGGLSGLTFVVLMAGFFCGGWLAAGEAPHEGVRHGTVAALAAYVPVQVMAVLGRLDRDAGVAPVSIVVYGFLAAVAGTLGGRLGTAQRARRSSP
jgi:putative membrane protein (TIGR04086 family)